MLFRSEEEVAGWCAQADMPRGELLSLDQVWQLSQAWYGDRLERDYQGRSPAAAEAIFASVGLSGPFWRFAG